MRFAACNTGISFIPHKYYSNFVSPITNYKQINKFHGSYIWSPKSYFFLCCMWQHSLNFDGDRIVIFTVPQDVDKLQKKIDNLLFITEQAVQLVCSGKNKSTIMKTNLAM